MLVMILILKDDKENDDMKDGRAQQGVGRVSLGNIFLKKIT